tara:strand:- start:1448 stop:3187 length:1740 start_codon:yes stop_codon:yes gene_type:complete
METIYQYIHTIIANACVAEFKIDKADVDQTNFVVEKPKDDANGDLSTNICLLLSKVLNDNPFSIGEKLSQKLSTNKEFTKVTVAKPGFINFLIDKSLLYDFLKETLFNKEIIPILSKNETINVEYVSANPTGPLHVGHCRGAVFGDVLANLLEKTGHKVTREYYVNDAGVQINHLANSVLIRLKELCGEKIDEYPEEFYPGDYLIEIAQSFKDKYGADYLEKNNDSNLEQVKSFSVESLLSIIKNDLSKLDINQDLFVSEKNIVEQGKISAAIEILKQQGLIYNGVLEAPKGKKIDDWEPREQMLFKSSQFGDEVDRPLQKSNGEWTYFANDMAYHFDKYQRGSMHLIDIWGADHGGYIKRMNAAIEALTEKNAKFSVKLCQMVKIISDGKPLKMSKRSGDFVTLSEMVEKVGSDSIRFMMLYRKNEAPLEFDFQKVSEQSKDNPVFYVQYAHARISSVLRKIDEHKLKFNLSDFSQCNFDLLRSDHELDLIKKILDWSSVVITSVNLYEPHRIAYYLYELASSFHSLWNQGKIDSNLKFINEEDLEITYARLSLIIATQKTIKSGLNLLGVSAPDEMQ